MVLWQILTGLFLFQPDWRTSALCRIWHLLTFAATWWNVCIMVFCPLLYLRSNSTRCFTLNDSTMTKRILLPMLCVFVTASVFAQGQGLAGINEATSMMTSYFDPATKLCYAIGAVLGLVGGIKTYSKFSSGDPDTSKTAASWFFACIFLIVAATILRSFFL